MTPICHAQSRARSRTAAACVLKCDDLSRIGGESTNTLTRRPDGRRHNLRARAPPSVLPRRPSQPHSIPPGHGRSQCTAPARVRVFPRLHASVRPAPAPAATAPAPAPAPPPPPHARAAPSRSPIGRPPRAAAAGGGARKKNPSSPTRTGELHSP
ncbi:hypothetical protein BDA96_10G204200 [Sorghum bicolor]|uniref:Uncharacterized protein n=1 Tax=Sorghum bicolor TaxID=4558 RepID=A0A921Q327_SORBI|nr:hypothetical protein BDA96_10G204200 [Sorghum bicolor]